MINKNMSVADVVKVFPAAIDIFNEFHIDYCCKGKDNLAVALEAQGLESKSFIDLLNRKLTAAEKQAAAGLQDVHLLEQLDLPQLIDHINQTHHQLERKLLAEIDALINKVLIVHYDHHQAQLVPLHRLFSNLRTELQEHFVKEEKLVFPALLALGRGNAAKLQGIGELEAEHEAAGDILKKIETCTEDFTPPADGCTSYYLLFQKLQELVNDIYLHIFTENSILFPKAEEDVS